MYKFKDETMKVPAYIWSQEGSIEQGAINQIKNASSLPFAFHHTVLCPDGHFGYGAPIGGILASKDYIVPNFVGLDIGCGMGAIRTSLKEINQESLKKIMGGSKDYHGGIRSIIPVGFNHQSKKQDENLMPKTDKKLRILSQEYESALKQIGTLGGGNHFIEIQKGSDGHIWLMIHSGSRNFGLKIANYYNKLAENLNEKWHTGIDKKWELAFLPLDSQEGIEYMNEMQYAVDFALANRKLMMDNIKLVFAQEMKLDEDDFDEMINIAHNYASLENHFSENVLIHRKGATLAREGTIGIIPGSMGSASYIVEGLGNKDSFESCSHGAGRKMGRKEAIRTLNLEEEQKKMEGIIGAPRSQNDLEEAPGAYKPIDEVMANQADLVKVLVKLKPLAVIKG